MKAAWQEAITAKSRWEQRRERDRQRETERETDRERQRERQTEREREREREQARSFVQVRTIAGAVVCCVAFRARRVVDGDVQGGARGRQAAHFVGHRHNDGGRSDVYAEGDGGKQARWVA